MTKFSCVFQCDSHIPNPGGIGIHSGINIQAWTDTETDTHHVFNPHMFWDWDGVSLFWNRDGRSQFWDRDGRESSGKGQSRPDRHSARSNRRTTDILQL